MGIPKFYRWLSERYPLLNQRFTATEGAPDIDNLYLDMNGIIHNCTHANQREVKLNEEEMMLKIFDYIDKLVQIIRPKKLLFMAIDGVAPRAKMNQQRSRRFKAAKERLEIEADKRRKGEEIPADPFDSNCITPGTPFMERLGKHLRFFIRRKMSEDPLWQKPTVVFSGHDVPGEGEHKIMEYLRWEKRNPNYQPNQRHCLYGLDADLIMLSLVTHEPHFCLLREIVSYTGGNKGQPARETLDNPCAENFILFHIGLLREYFQAEFTNVSVPFETDNKVNVERVVDDFVLFCMLVGNDFLPALPTLDIAEGALNSIFSLYRELLPTMGGYLTQAGYLDRTRLEKLLAKVGDLELQVLEERAKDADYMESKKARRAANGQEAYVPPAARAATGALTRHAASTPSLPAAAAAAANGSAANGSAAKGSGSHAGQFRVAAGPSGDGKGFGGIARRILMQDHAASEPDLPSLGGEAEAASDDTATEENGSDKVNGATASNADVSALADGVGALDVSDSSTPPPPVEHHPPPAPVPAGPLAAFFEAIGVADAALPLEDDEPAAAVAAEPTMMSKEARQMMLSGLGMQGLQLWKDRWYGDKLNARTPAARRQVVECYVQGLHWVLEYYYRGVASWDWYYPYYYAPMASDMTDLQSIQVRFTQGKPFRPYEQLLSVLPAASAPLLPPAYQRFMLNPDSPILDFYPTEFEVDMEGKRASWEGVVKVPFVDEARLLAAVAALGDSVLSTAEQQRNTLGEILVFSYSPNSKDRDYCTSTMPQVFRDVTQPQSRLIRRKMPPPLPEGERGFTPELLPGTHTGLQCPKGYPTLQTLRVQAALKNVSVNVLGTPSRKESLILSLPSVGQGIKAATFEPILGQRCYVNWPYLQEARIMRISDATEQWVFTGHRQPQCKKWQSDEATRWRTEATAMASSLLTRFGMDVGTVEIVMHVKVCKGYLQYLDGTLQKQYLDTEIGVPLQCVLRTRPNGGPEAAPGTPESQSATGDDDTPVIETLKEGDRAVFLGKGHYGAMATVMQTLGTGLTKAGAPIKTPGPKTYRISVVPLGPTGLDVGARAARLGAATVPRFYPSHEVGRKLRINPRVLGRITTNVWVTDGDERYDVGLAVRAHAKGLCVPGFAAPTADGNSWQYSQGMVDVLGQYREAHPWIFTALDKQASAPDTGERGSLRLAELLPNLTQDERRAKAAAAMKWVKNSPLGGKPLVKTSVQMMPDEGVKKVQMAMPNKVAYPPVELENVPPALLLAGFVPGPEQVKLQIQGGHFDLGDRAVCLLKAGIPAFGLVGTVIGVYDDALEMLFDHEFVGGTTLGGKVTGRCGAQVPKDIMLNISRPVQMPINKSQVPRPTSGAPPAAGRTSSVPAPMSPEGAAAAARQAAASHAPPPAARRAVSDATHTGRAASARGASNNTPVVPASVSGGGPPPPMPSASVIAAAAGQQSGKHGHRAPTHVGHQAGPGRPHSAGHTPHGPPPPPTHAGAKLLEQLQKGRVPAAAPPPPARGPQGPQYVPVQPHQHHVPHHPPPPPHHQQHHHVPHHVPMHHPPHPGMAPYAVHQQAALGHIPVHGTHPAHHGPPHPPPPPPRGAQRTSLDVNQLFQRAEQPPPPAPAQPRAPLSLAELESSMAQNNARSPAK